MAERSQRKITVLLVDDHAVVCDPEVDLEALGADGFSAIRLGMETIG